MILNFDKNKFPLDHEWVDNSDYKYHPEVFVEVFDIAYSVICSKCRLNLVNQKLNKNYKKYEEIKLYEDDNMFYIIRDNEYMNFHTDEIDYEYIYSCSEFIIKDLLE